MQNIDAQILKATDHLNGILAVSLILAESDDPELRRLSDSIRDHAHAIDAKFWAAKRRMREMNGDTEDNL